ncbi:MAG TPA: SpoIID/LytB domain-containing protein, partial [Gemmatimonadales bacterium]|nr:SpoIID/LytB domain-containing protein [Gemmatimonadales bacterium]
TGAAWLALAATKGEVLTYRGAPIDAFFHSTCGGRTASGAEVFPNADRPYLRSVSDLDPSGQAWCRSSPRFEWSESFDQAHLTAALVRGLRLRPEEAAGVRSIEAIARSASGRVTRLRVRLRGRDIVIDGSNAVRRALPPPDLDLLRSATFTVTFRGDGDRIERLDLQGAGAGHGVGLCQWGAVGRARAGARYAEILAAYYPGTTMDRRW